MRRVSSGWRERPNLRIYIGPTAFNKQSFDRIVAVKVVVSYLSVLQDSLLSSLFS
jgi:hypothetical protein